MWDEVLLTALIAAAAVAIHQYTDAVCNPTGSSAVETPYDECSTPLLSNVAHSLVAFPLAFLVVFRSNQAYSRWWTARGNLGAMAGATQHMTRRLVASTDVESLRQDVVRKVNLLFCLMYEALTDVADFNFAKDFALDNEADALRSYAKGDRVQIVSVDLLRTLRNAADEGDIDWIDCNAIDKEAQGMMDNFRSASKIGTTPIPLPFAQMCQFLLTVWVLSLPFTLVHIFGWYTTIVSAIVALCFFGINEIAIQIEKPFGQDDNDLDMEAFRKSVVNNTSYLLDLHNNEMKFFNASKVE